MDRETLEARMAHLDELKLQQTQRLEGARREIQGATTSLERIEGARQDCEYWLDQLAAPVADKDNGVDVVELLRNGEVN